MDILPFQQKPKPPAKTGFESITPTNYHERVTKFVQGLGPCELPNLALDTPEFEAWRRYFDDHLRWRPWAFKAFASQQTKGFTVPTQWPEWFDVNFIGSQN